MEEMCWEHTKHSTEQDLINCVSTEVKSAEAHYKEVWQADRIEDRWGPLVAQEELLVNLFVEEQEGETKLGSHKRVSRWIAKFTRAVSKVFVCQWRVIELRSWIMKCLFECVVPV